MTARLASSDQAVEEILLPLWHLKFKALITRSVGICSPKN